jgi:16S rRNA (guanine966-N2)-methyltransferase
LLRITGGTLKGRKLQTAKGVYTRPTLEKTRQAIFNMLQHRYDLSRFEVIDLFAGSGALGFEAISRGAESAVFIDHDRGCAALIQSGIIRLALQSCCRAICRDALDWLREKRWEKRRYLFLIDPPYRSGLLPLVLQQLDERGCSLSGSLMVLETDKALELQAPERFLLIREKRFGDTRLGLFEIV